MLAYQKLGNVTGRATSTTELAFRSAVDLAAAIRRCEVGSRELLELYLARVERFDGALNAVVTLDAERALARADEADAALERGELWGPLHGLPMTVKDQFETAGIRTTCGSDRYAAYVPATDAEPVARLKSAGAIVFGKTNLPELAGDWQTSNALFGTTNNPWDPARTAGGSSGGAAAALAAGLTALELGGDIGGSIRNPAGWCGVYGHKPSFGLVPKRGTLPAPPGALSTSDVAVAGPLARSADDLDLALGVLAGPDERDRVAWRLELPPPRPGRRLALWADDTSCPVDAEVRDRVEAAAEALERAGAHVDRSARPAVRLDDVVRLRQRLVYPILALGLSEAGFAAEAERARAAAPEDESRLARRARDATQSHRDWLRANEEREQVRARFAEFFRDFDALLVPVAPVPAIPHDHRDVDERRLVVNGRERPYSDLGGWISLAGVAYLPSTVAPAGRTRDGLPVGVEIVGPFLEDRTTIELARRLAGLIGGFEAPPLGNLAAPQGVERA